MWDVVVVGIEKFFFFFFFFFFWWVEKVFFFFFCFERGRRSFFLCVENDFIYLWKEKINYLIKSYRGEVKRSTQWELDGTN